MQKQRYHSDGSCQGRFANPRVAVQEHRGAPLLNCSGIVIIRQLIERLGIARAINAGLRVLRRHKPYAESDHILTLIYNLLSGGETLNDINRLADDAALLRVLGTEQVPHATTVGDFLARFRHEKDEAKAQEPRRLRKLRQVIEAIQQASFALLPRRRRTVATLDWDSSNHEVYGEQKEGADFAHDKKWCYNVLYATLAETGDVLYQGLREGCTYTSAGTTEVLPGTIERVSRYFRNVRMRADSGFYDQEIVKICAEREVEFFIVAEQRRNLLKAVHAIPESDWKSFEGKHMQRGGGSGKQRKRRENLKRKITLARKPDTWFKGKPQVASIEFRPSTWKQSYRYVIKRTPVIDKDEQQLCLDDGLRKYAYYIVVTNSKRSDAAVLSIAQGRGNQENLIKDFKHGLGLSHVPTGVLAANQAYFLIAALAWNLKTWMLNLLGLGDGAVMRCKRFLYLWINQAGVVAKSGRDTVVLRLPPGEYYQRFGTALARVAAL